MTTILGQSYKQLIALWNEPASRQGVPLEDKMTTVGAKEPGEGYSGRNGRFFGLM